MEASNKWIKVNKGIYTDGEWVAYWTRRAEWSVGRKLYPDPQNLPEWTLFQDGALHHLKTLVECQDHAASVSNIPPPDIRYTPPDNRKYLYGEQAGFCNGCEAHFEIRHLEVDHITPKSKGGPDDISNLQLLCTSCNRLKGAGSHAELHGNCRTMQTVEKQVVLEENWQVLAVVFPPFAQRLENSVSRACWPGSMSLGVFHSSHGLCYCSRLYGQANGEQIWDPEGANHVPTSPFTG